MSAEQIIILEDEQPAGGLIVDTTRKISETMVVSAGDAYGLVRRLAHESNVRRVRLVKRDGKVLLDLPLYAGVVSAALLGTLAAIPLVVAFMAEVSIIVERRADDEQEIAEQEIAKQIVIHDAVDAQPDDLKKINGVGPKTALLLHDAGIRTYNDLGTTSVARLQEILAAAGERYRLLDPATWPEQARQLAGS
jgi:predicted flap endonuclease-1-like 5' DNA nuclease